MHICQNCAQQAIANGELGNLAAGCNHAAAAGSFSVFSAVLVAASAAALVVLSRRLVRQLGERRVLVTA